LKPKERAMFRELNKSPFIKFPIKVNIASSAHKVSLIIQVQLGGIDLPNDKEFNAIRTQYLSEKNLVFDRMKRLIRCVVDCKAYDCDAVATRSSLDLARSIHAGYWENMHLQLRQIPDIGPAGARKLVQADIRSIQQLSALQSSDIERILSRNPPFGKKIKDSTNDFPRFTLKATLTGNILRAGECIKTKIKAQMGLSNSKFPKFENRNPNVSFLATVSSGTLAHFWRGSLRKLEKEFEISFTAELTGPEDIITCYVACDEIVGTIKTVDLQPDILASAFPPPKPKYALKEIKKSQEIVSADSDEEYGMDEIEEKDLLAAVQTAEAPVDNHGQKPKLDDFFDIDDFDDDLLNDTVESPNEPAHPVKMENGKWACNHFCSQGSLLKSGKPCSHKCCRDGVDKPHRITKKKVYQNQKIPLGAWLTILFSR
jgi:ATP-dependent DNA helicase HFM1/MER3